jgi:hypothetical protein
MVHTSNKYKNYPEAFNKYFLSTPGKIIQGIGYSNIKDANSSIEPKYYLSKTFQNSFPNIKLKIH